MSGPPYAPIPVDISQLVAVGQQTNIILTKILAALNTGVAINPVPSVYTVAGLPASAASGQWAFASNARKPGEGAGAGTGIGVFFNSATGTWFTTLGAVVTA